MLDHRLSYSASHLPFSPTSSVCSTLDSVKMKRIERFTRNDSATTDTTATLSSSNYSAFLDKSWLEDPAAWDHFCSVLTSLYALFIIVFAVVVELSSSFTSDEWFSETLFYSYMYGAGVVFLVYCYLFKVHPSWFNWLLKSATKRRWISATSEWYIPKTNHTGDGAGSLYLRLGTLCFGSSGIVLFCLEMFMCFSDRRCFTYKIINWVFAGMFTFVQMHFIFCNSTIAIVDSKNMAKLGTMHLLAVNIWTWLRFVIAKSSALERVPLSTIVGNSSKKQMDFSPSDFTIMIEKSQISPTIFSFDYFGDFATLLTTCIIEYSVIGAAIMIVLWRSIDDNSCEGTLKSKKKKHKVRIDCSASSGGLFAGLLFLICALVSIGIHSFFSQHCDSHGALLVFRLSDMALFCLTLIGCSIGLYKMRILQYHQQRSSSAEFLDEILLVIGLVGELIHSSTGIMCWISTQSERVPIKMEFYMLFVFITRIIQVVVQAVFILLARRLRALSEEAINNKPGKQFVTFLLIANVSLFFFHTLEGMKSVFGDTIASRRTRPYAALIVGVAPLVVFYRFHSSVCLAEIWKHCYNIKNRTSSAPSKRKEVEALDIVCVKDLNSNGDSFRNHV
ncbi:otopetrin domain-containing protein [Ditylenchus destructor]|nr:otopetrin domain-containing protein [Ditylenchus destructor]